MNPTPLQAMSATQAALMLQRRELRAEDYMRACLERIQAREDDVHAFAHLDAVSALAQARALDAGPVRGPLHGLPVGVKDVIDTSDLPTTLGSLLYAGRRPVSDAACVALCRDAGGLIAGKTVTTEFAYFRPGPTANPHHLLHTPGGSSSGSAAAVADCLVPLALGTQTAGSIIRPAAFCGIVGYKPSLGRVSTMGFANTAPSLDVIGGFGRTVDDAALLGATLTSDPRLMTTRLDGPLRVGLFQSPAWDQADLDVHRCWEIATAALARQGIQCVDKHAPDGYEALARLQVDVMSFEMARSFSHDRLRHREALSAVLQSLLDQGAAIPGDVHARHLLAMQEWRQRVDAWLADVDVLLTPSSLGAAPRGLDSTGDPLFCRMASLIGLPALHLPLTLNPAGLPIGLQLVGRRYEDARLMAAGRHLHPLIQH